MVRSRQVRLAPTFDQRAEWLKVRRWLRRHSRGPSPEGPARWVLLTGPPTHLLALGWLSCTTLLYLATVYCCLQVHSPDGRLLRLGGRGAQRRVKPGEMLKVKIRFMSVREHRQRRFSMNGREKL